VRNKSKGALPRYHVDKRENEKKYNEIHGWYAHMKIVTYDGKEMIRNKINML